MGDATSKKSFTGLHDAEEFFHASCDERAADVEAVATLVKQQTQGLPKVRLLDFGSGDGTFLEEVLVRSNLAADKVSVVAVDVDLSYRAAYLRRLRPACNGIETRGSLPIDGVFDVIIANHVLYYVDSIDKCVDQLARNMSPHGVAYFTMGSPLLPLSKLWGQLFELVGKPVPYFGADDLKMALQRSQMKYAIKAVPFRVRFADTIANRALFLRFLVGEHYDAIAPRADPLLAQFSKGGNGRVIIDHEDWLFQVKREAS